MTKRASIICLVGFILCFVGVIALGIFSGGVKYMHGSTRYTYNTLWTLLAVLFLPGLMSYLFSRSWPEFRKDKANREFVRKNKLLHFLFGAKSGIKEWTTGSISSGHADLAAMAGCRPIITF